MRNFAKVALPPILSVIEALCALLIFVMMILTFADVVGRYVFTAPIFGAAEMIQFLLAMTIFAGLCLVNAHDTHITVDIFEARLERLFPYLRRYLVQGFSVFVMAIIAVEMTKIAFETHELGSITVVLEWPLVIVTSAVAFLSVVSLIVQVLGLALPKHSAHQDDTGDML